ncbi:unnamed protein product [Diamesa hyperborea]
MTNLEQHHEIVKTSLFQFIKKHIPGANLSVVDQIVLEYVVSILEEASQDESFDVEGFQEMMSAYIEDFAGITPAVICSWIFELESQLSQLNKPKENAKPLINLDTLSLTSLLPEEKLRGRQPGQPSASANSDCTDIMRSKRIQHLSETSDGGGSTDSSNCDLFHEELEQIQEMFPESTYMEVKYCMTIANGEIERARQIIIHRQETGQSIHNSSRNTNKHKTHVKLDEKELKNRIIERYSYVDQSIEHTREHRPVVPKVEPKKLIRYRDNKIVSLKGEKYTENRDDDGELRKPKKVLP